MKKLHKGIVVLIILIIVIVGASLYLATKKNVELKNFSWNGNALSLSYPSKVCYGDDKKSDCRGLEIVKIEDRVIIGQKMMSSGAFGGDEFIDPIFTVYHDDTISSQNQAEKYLRSHGFPAVISWGVKKGEIGDVSVANFADAPKFHVAYSKTLSTLVAFSNNTDMACLIDCGVIENGIYHGIKLDGVEVFPRE